MTSALSVQDLRVCLGELEILKGVELQVPFGEVHALMGPNGSGKSTLTHALMGKPGYEVEGRAQVGGVEIIGLPVDERARAGLFQAFQYPVEIPGVALSELVDEMAAAEGDWDWLRNRAEAAGEELGIGPFLDRAVNVGLSGGEKKRSEMFQLAVTAPVVAILDEIDSGLDIDAVQEVAALVEALRSPSLGILIITHYSRILRYIDVDRIHVMISGAIVESGGAEVADRLESEGYAGLAAG
jgi:Fe-S cluster assembly ATP-binding protein